MKRWGMAILFLSSLISVTVVGACLNSQIRAEEGDPEPSEDVAIDETNFPDDNFRRYVLLEIDENYNKILEPLEVSSTQNISISYKYGSLDSLQGIEFFIRLKSLNCENLQLKSLDISQNTNLEKLYCAHNDFKTIDLSNCPKLLEAINSGELELENNDEQYVVKDVFRIDSFVQTTPQLFDPLPEPVEGEDIPIDEWHFPDPVFRSYVQSLDNDGDKTLSKEERSNLLDYQKSIKVYTLRGIEYFPSLKTLTILEYSSKKLRALDLSANTELTKLVCTGTALTELDLSNNTLLRQIDCSNNRLQSLSLGTNSSLVKLDCSNNSLTSLDVSHATSLNQLTCSSNRIASLDVSQNTMLTDLICNSNQLEELHIDQNTELKSLVCESNKLTRLNLSHNTSLEWINCQTNRLTALDVSNCKKLTSLYCQWNELTDLDISQNTALIYLYCFSNQLKSLDASANTELVVLDCSSNQLTNLNVSTSTQMTQLYCSFNQLTDLDASNNTKLRWLYCDSNQLTSLDVSKDTLLYSLRCSSNKLTTLDVSTNTSLAYLLCSFNSFEQLDLTNCKIWFNEGYFVNGGRQFRGTIVDDYVEVTFEVDSYVVTNPLLFDPVITPTPTPTNTPTPTQGPTPTPKTPTQGPTKTPTKNPTISPTPTKAPVKDPTFEDFVERLYTVALGRASEPEGKAFWIKQVVEEGKTGADCARFFLLDADEFMKRGLSVEDFVETLYATFFDRESDAAGKKGWVDAIKSGKKTRAEVVNDFIESTEWCNVCATYGVKSGAKWHKATFASKNAKDFATRLYTCCLGRDPEEGGLKYWSLALTNLEQTGCSAAKLFFTSDEFVGFKLKDEEYIKRLYTTFMGREPAASEVSYWMGEIKKGTQTKYSVMQFFGQSPEFTGICKKYGIDRGEI